MHLRPEVFSIQHAQVVVEADLQLPNVMGVRVLGTLEREMVLIAGHDLFNDVLDALAMSTVRLK